MSQSKNFAIVATSSCLAGGNYLSGPSTDITSYR